MGKRHLTSEEVLKEAGELGLELAERKLKYYVTLGIIPKPLRNPGGDYDGRIAYFPAEVVERLRKIKELQDSGFTLPQIKQYFQQSIDPELQQFLQKNMGDSGHVPLDALLKLISSDEIKKATGLFQLRVSSDDSEAVFEKAAMEYYTDVLSLLMGRDNAGRYVKDCIVNAPPEQRMKRIEPLRRLKKQITGRPGSLSSLLESLCVQLEKGSYQESRVLDKLKELAEKVHFLQGKYRDSTLALNESFDISRFIRQTFWVYLKALLELESFMKDGDPGHLSRARALSMRSEQLLDGLESLVSGIKNLVAVYEETEKL